MTEQQIAEMSIEDTRARLNDLFQLVSGTTLFQEDDLGYVEQNAARFAAEYPGIASQPDREDAI